MIAEKQKKGRGQYGKKWVSYKGNLFVSIFFPINNIKLSLKNLTKLNCLLVKKLVSEFYKGKIYPFKGELEIWYQNHKSFILDMKLIFVTAWVILSPNSKLYEKLFKNLPKRSF